MARNERGLPREKTGGKKPRGGKPSMDVPGKGKVVSPLGGMSNRSAANYADAMAAYGGSKGQEHKYGQG